MADGSVRCVQTANAANETERRKHAAELGSELAQRVSTGSVGNAATAGALGDFFQYTIDHPVSLARQKSAMLPIVGKDIEGQKVSIYNQFVQAKHPLLGPEVQEHLGAHLNQGPITVFEGSVYAGDTRVLDVQPNEERIVSYAIDLGHRSRSAGRPRHAEDHQRQGREGHRHHGDESDGREEVSDRQPRRRPTARC